MADGVSEYQKKRPEEHHEGQREGDDDAESLRDEVGTGRRQRETSGAEEDDDEDRDADRVTEILRLQTLRAQVLDARADLIYGGGGREGDEE